jgi:acyl-coenzyme A thioesterase PaaI-like protein
MSIKLSAVRVKPKTERCYVCGPENPEGLHVQFFRDGPQGCRALYTARTEHNGWPGMQHGGVTFALMDEALGWAVHFQGLQGVTARADTRFRQPVSTGDKLIIRGWTLERRHRLMTARAEIRLDNPEQTLVAETNATMFLLDADQSA